MEYFQVVDIDSGRELGCDEEGEILVRNPGVMKGYLNNPAGSSTAIDKQGWLHTGRCTLTINTGDILLGSGW